MGTIATVAATVDAFQRQAGPKDTPTLLVHGIPSSSATLESLIPLLTDTYHHTVLGYPGFGLSGAPPPSRYADTFNHIAGE